MAEDAKPTAGWYPDPEGDGQRYWDGEQWTDRRRGAGDEPSTLGRLSERTSWIVGGALLAVLFVLGYLRGSANETTAESVGGGLGTLIFALGVAALGRLAWWLATKRRHPYGSPWIAVIAACVGAVAIIGAAAQDREDNEREAGEAAAAAESCREETGSDPLAADGLTFTPVRDDEALAPIEAAGLTEAIDFYKVKPEASPGALAVVAVVAIGADDDETYSDFLDGVGDESGSSGEVESIDSTEVTRFSSTGLDAVVFQGECYVTAVYGTSATATDVARRIIAAT